MSIYIHLPSFAFIYPHLLSGKQAKEYQERALAIRQQTLGPQHPDVASSYNNIATVLLGQGDLKQAKEYHERALAIRQQTLGPQHPDVAQS